MAQVFADMQSGKQAADEADVARDLAAAVAAPAAPAAATVPAAELSAVELDGDDELLSIFLEEAREVVDNGLQALRRWRTSPAI
jgi:chemosensory pili system protein ChpA (sensor histidine kinase/response regulator)